MSDKIFADIQYGGLDGLTPVSVGLVLSNGDHLYVEASDAGFGAPEVLMKFQKTVGTVFVPADDIGKVVISWLTRWVTSCVDTEIQVDCSTSLVSQTLEAWLVNYREQSPRILVRHANTSGEVITRFFEVCGGPDRARGHALMEAIALAAAALEGGLRLPVDTTKFGLLIGPKNSLSTRVFLRRIASSNSSVRPSENHAI